MVKLSLNQGDDTLSASEFASNSTPIEGKGEKAE
jgi:hypothetical protein